MHWLPGAEDALWRRNEMCEISLKSVSSSSAPPPPSLPTHRHEGAAVLQSVTSVAKTFYQFYQKVPDCFELGKKKQTKKKTENCGIYVVKMWQCVAFCMWDEVGRTFHCKIWPVSEFFSFTNLFQIWIDVAETPKRNHEMTAFPLSGVVQQNEMHQAFIRPPFWKGADGVYVHRSFTPIGATTFALCVTAAADKNPQFQHSRKTCTADHSGVQRNKNRDVKC